MEKKKLIPAFFAALTVYLFSMTGCTSSRPLAANAQGTSAEAIVPGDFVVSMTDSPGDYSELNIEISKVEAFLDNRGWIVLTDEPQYINVLALTNGAETRLSHTESINTGSYTKLRLTFGDENYVKFNPGAELPETGLNANGAARLEWNESREVVVDINHEVNDENGASILLDFNVAQSIMRQENKYVLQPVITEIEDAYTGIQGSIENTTVAAIIVTDGVYNYSTYTNDKGEFLLRGIDPGTYDVLIVPAGQDLNGTTEHRIEGIIIADGTISQMGSIHL